MIANGQSVKAGRARCYDIDVSAILVVTSVSTVSVVSVVSLSADVACGRLWAMVGRKKRASAQARLPRFTVEEGASQTNGGEGQPILRLLVAVKTEFGTYGPDKCDTASSRRVRA